MTDQEFDTFLDETLDLVEVSRKRVRRIGVLLVEEADNLTPQARDAWEAIRCSERDVCGEALKRVIPVWTQMQDDEQVRIEAELDAEMARETN